MAEPPDELSRLKIAIDQLAQRVQALERRMESDPARARGIPVVTDRSWGVRLANRIGAFTVAVGVIFFFKYAVDENLIAAGAGVWLGLVFGVALLFAGEWLSRRKQRVLAQGITGCGVATIYTALYASYAYYNLVPETVGFGGLLAISAGAIFLSFRYTNPAIAAIGFLGAIITPLLLRYGHSNLVSTFLYFALVVISELIVSFRMRWAVLVPLVASVSLFCAGVSFGSKHLLALASFASMLTFLHFFAAAREPAGGSLRQSSLVVAHAGLLLAGFCLIQVWVKPTNFVTELDSLLLALYGIALLVAGSFRASSLLRVLGSVLLGLVIAKLYLFDVWSLARVYRITAFVGLGVLLLLASYLYSRSDRRASAS